MKTMRHAASVIKIKQSLINKAKYMAIISYSKGETGVGITNDKAC